MSTRVTVFSKQRNMHKFSGLKFAYATNGKGIVEHDFVTGRDNDLDAFPSAEALWDGFAQD